MASFLIPNEENEIIMIAYILDFKTPPKLTELFCFYVCNKKCMCNEKY